MRFLGGALYMVPARALGQLLSPGRSAGGAGRRGSPFSPGGFLHLVVWTASWHGDWVPRRNIPNSIPGGQTPIASAYQAFAFNMLTTDSLAGASHVARLLVHVGGLHRGQIPG